MLSRSRRRIYAEVLLGFVLAIVTTSCSTSDEGSRSRASSTPGSVPIITPTTAYGPFPYANTTQQSAFQAFLTCAADHGLKYEGPFADSTGKGVYLRLAPGEQASHAEQERVTTECPQGDVAIFGTAVGRVREGPFMRAATTFAHCLQAHEDPNYPSPDFGRGDPLEDFWQLPFDWSSTQFTQAVKGCVDALRNYLFGG